MAQLLYTALVIALLYLQRSDREVGSTSNIYALNNIANHYTEIEQLGHKVIHL
jgi:hypothetical protein